MDSSLGLQIGIFAAGFATLVIPVVQKTIRRSKGGLTRSGWVFVLCAGLNVVLGFFAWYRADQSALRSEKQIADIREEQLHAALTIAPSDFQLFVFTIASPPLDQLDKIEKALASHSTAMPELIPIAGRIGDMGSSRSIPFSFDLVPIPARRVLMRRIGGYIDLTYQARNFVVLERLPTVPHLKGQKLSFTLPIERLEFFKGQWLESAELYVKGNRYDGIVRRLEDEVVFDFE